MFARQNHGAIYGQGEGPQGNSYALPTKDKNIKTLPLDEIAHHVRRFIRYAAENPHTEFEVTKIGCGLAGYSEKQIAPLFRDAPENCILPDGWREKFGEDVRIEGPK